MEELVTIADTSLLAALMLPFENTTTSKVFDVAWLVLHVMVEREPLVRIYGQWNEKQHAVMPHAHLIREQAMGQDSAARRTAAWSVRRSLLGGADVKLDNYGFARAITELHSRIMAILLMQDTTWWDDVQ